MSRVQSVVNLDPIDRRNRKKKGNIGRFFITKHFKGKGMAKTDPFGHYLFVGRQRSGKTVSMVWYRDFLERKYNKKQIKLFSNMGFGFPVHKATIVPLIDKCVYDPNIVYIFCIDEIQAWFPKDTKDPLTLKIIDDLTGQFSQLGKRQIYVLSTAQIYGRVNKNLREQCLYMVNCRRSMINNRVINDFIDGDDIICDDLGRWSGDPKFIYAHGLPKSQFDTHLMIKD